MKFNSNIRNNFKNTARIVLIFILLALLALVARLLQLEILESEKYTTMSDKNRIRVYPILQRRGRIITSDGKVIAQNRQKYRLSIESCELDAFIKNIDLIASMISLTDEDKRKLFEIRKKTPRYAPMLVKDELSWDEYTKISMNFYKLNHVSLENSFIREYLSPLEFGHIVGYTTRSNNYLQSIHGQTGIEASMDAKLSGIPGNKKIEINSLGKKMRVLDTVEPIDGEDVVITINSEIQKYVYDLISVEKAGACVVLDITDGSVVALVSVPGLDTNPISSRISQKEWNDLINDPLKPLLNRAISGVYPPGSVFKIVTILAALEEKLISPKDIVFCSGKTVLDGNTFHCWKRSGHGKVNAVDALRFSCDCYIFEIAKKIGINTVYKYAKKLGFGEKTGIEIPNENAGLLPNKQWKLLKYHQNWKPYETVITAIGQGALLSTLIQTANMLGKIYTNNYDFQATIIKKENEDQKKGLESLESNSIKSENLEVIKKALFQVCNAGGTASGSCRTSYGISGKTGSSQVKRIKKGEEGMNQNLLPWNLRDHAFFVGCAPYKNPKYVVAVMIEHGGGGASKAAPIARKIFDKLMLREKNNK